MANKETSPGIPPQGDPQQIPSLLAQIQEFSKTSPAGPLSMEIETSTSDPENSETTATNLVGTESTIDWCDRGLRLGTQLIEQVTSARYPQDAHEVAALDAARSSYQPLAGEFVIEKGNLLLQLGKKKTAFSTFEVTDSIIRSLATASSDLGVMEYVRAFMPSADRGNNYQHFTHDYNRIRRLAGIPLYPTREDEQPQIALPSPEHPIFQIIATAYAMQVAKNAGVTGTRQFITRAVGLEEQTNLDNSGFNPGIIIPGFIKQARDMITPVRRHEEYILRGKRAIERAQRALGITEEQLQVIMDIAFISADVFRTESDQVGKTYEDLVGPIVQYAFQGEWDQAIAHRNYALKYFSHAFPDWRRAAAAQHEELFARSSLYQAAELDIRNHNGNWDIERTPEGYREYYPQVFRREDSTLGTWSKVINFNFESAPLSSRLVKALTGDMQQRILITDMGRTHSVAPDAESTQPPQLFQNFLLERIYKQPREKIEELARIIADQYMDLLTTHQATFSLDEYLSRFVPTQSYDEDSQFLISEVRRRLAA